VAQKQSLMNKVPSPNMHTQPISTLISSKQSKINLLIDQSNSTSNRNLNISTNTNTNTN
jgi:hypothetical protein